MDMRLNLPCGRLTLSLSDKQLDTVLLAGKRLGLEEPEWSREAIVSMVFQSAVEEILARCCRVCGCTDTHGCDEGCEWVDEDLCSACV